MNEGSHLDVLMISPQRVVFEGPASRVILPGEQGVFEVLPYHKRLLSRLLGGWVVIDRETFRIKRGVAKVGIRQLTVIVEES